MVGVAVEVPIPLLLGVVARLFLGLEPSRCTFAAFRDGSVDVPSRLDLREDAFDFEESDRNCRRVGRLDSSNSRSL